MVKKPKRKNRGKAANDEHLDFSAASTPAVQALMEMMNAGKTNQLGLDLMLDEILQDAPAMLRPMVKKVAKPRGVKKIDFALLERWQNWSFEFVDMFLIDFDEEEIDYSVNFNIEAILEDGLVVAQYKTKQEQHRLFINVNPKAKQRWGCDCLNSLGSSRCIHTFTLADFLSQMLDYEDSEISELIATRAFHKKRPDLTKLGQVDPKVVKQYLDQKLPRITAPIAQDPSELGDIATESPSRLCWDVVGTDHNAELELRLQQGKKRGVGWTKGKRLTVTSLHTHLDVASDADRKILRQIDGNMLHYGRTLTFNVVEACYHLVGQPNVMLNGKPIEVLRFHPELEFYQTDQHCGVRRKTGFQDQEVGPILASHNRLLELLPKTGQIRVASMSEDGLTTFKALLTMPPLPQTSADELIDRVKAYQNVLAIDLPASRQTTEPEETRPVLLLRSRKDGKLDYGFRVRGSRNNLYMPGVGQSFVQPKPKKGQATVTLKRNFNRERTESDQLADRLQLPAEPQQGTLGDFEQALQVLETAQQLETEGDIEVLWDKHSVEPIRMLGTVTANALRVEVGASRDWFQLKGHCELANGSIDLSELLSGVADNETRGQFVRFGKHGWAKVSKQLRGQLNRVSDTVSRDRKNLSFDASAVPALQSFLQEEVQAKAGKKWKECLDRIERSKQLVPKVPETLRAELREYQIEGFGWLRRLAEWGVGGILADDMGLGKTLQTLAVLLDRAVDGPALVVAPTSVGFNWKNETERFAPDLNVHLYRDTDRDQFLDELGPQDLVVCSYGLLLRDAAKLSQIKWATFVLDEAQAIKNNRSKTAVAAKTIDANWKLALTGTPMENHLGELWSIFNVVAPGVFGGWANFRTRFATPIEKNQDDERRGALRDRIQPFVLRRTKSEVLKDLPPRTDQNLTIELSNEERVVYDRVRMSAIGEVDEISKLHDVQDQRFRLLALLTRLRQLACSPKLVYEDWSKRSSKLQQLAETVGSLKAEGHRVLIFSQFVKHLSLIREMLAEEEITFEYLDGSTPAAARQERVERFQTGDATAFLISLKAGGTGLNLTAADYVIHMDPWWNPAVEDQATDRAHRIGQQRPVMCYRFVAQGTIEEEILKLHDTKRDLVAGVLEGSSSAAKLTTSDLIDMIRR